METTEMNAPRKEEVTIKFGKGLVGKPFTTKNGKECVGIKIPNADPADKTPWDASGVPATSGETARTRYQPAASADWRGAEVKPYAWNSQSAGRDYSVRVFA